MSLLIFKEAILCPLLLVKIQRADLLQMETKLMDQIFCPQGTHQNILPEEHGFR